MRLPPIILLLTLLHQTQTLSTTPILLEHSLIKVRPLTTYTPRSTTLSLFAARNEYESFQIVINGPNTINNVHVTPLFKGYDPIIYRQTYLNVTEVSDCYGKLGLWPDALVPDVDVFYHEKRNVFPLVVPKGQNKALWVDLFVPSNATAGMYRGMMIVLYFNLIYHLLDVVESWLCAAITFIFSVR